MTRPEHTPDRTTRRAALWATVVAVPLAVLTGWLVFSAVDRGPAGGTGAASPSPTAARPQSTAPVAMSAPALSQRATVVCRALLSRLPRSVRDLAQRPVTAGAEQNAAYGDPAITVACGVPAPSFPPTDLVYPLDRVCWHAVERPDATVWTTVDRQVPVQVTVPRVYEQPGQWTNEFSATVTETVPSATSAPSGCGG